LTIFALMSGQTFSIVSNSMMSSFVPGGIPLRVSLG
jgi:hypothetical protein